MKIQVKFNEYTLNYYYRLGTNFSNKDILAVKIQLDFINESSGCNFSYGIFDKSKDFKKQTENFIICVIEKDDESVGFFYNYIMEEEKIVHLGLVLIAKNFGENLLYIPYMIASKIIYTYIGEFYVTNISAVPKIIGSVISAFEDTWPAPKANLIRPNPEYRRVAKLLYENYVKNYFPMPESISFDERRFILSCNAKEMGFESDFRKLARDADLEVNLFCMFWINYDKNEDMVQVAKYSKDSLAKNESIICKYYNPK